MNKTLTQKKITTTNEKNEKNKNNRNFAEEPREEVIDNILNYSKALSISKSSYLEHIEVVSN